MLQRVKALKPCYFRYLSLSNESSYIANRIYLYKADSRTVPGITGYYTAARFLTYSVMICFTISAASVSS